ncbi:hypothetical protein [Dokdonella sp.]|uniref:hypothetical protein n=1 Tax=Dokdonella sp. TaxID=2291710 RepID=UPI0035296D08
MFITRPRIFGVALALVTPPAVAGSGSGWVLETVPTSEVLNGVSAPSLDYAMAVGNNGTIVLFENGDTGTLMVSGTSKDLLDVYASSPNLAVAAGIDTVLLWDGMSWDEIRNTTDGTLFTGTWISPEEDVVLYGILGASFDFVCPYFPAMPDPPPFCRTFGRALLAACGHSDDIKVITEDGDVYRVDNFLGDIDATNPIHEEPGLLGLTAVYAPQLSCLSGAVPPRSMFAIRQSGEIWHFDGDNWTDMNVPIPASQTLTAISGTGPGLVVASGFEPKPRWWE